ncbi:MAG TPA: alpha/beta hydrolase, partial [Pirellulales bacterium]|nr:alpha/beta hydrolase [Pirellulales bacterium]
LCCRQFVSRWAARLVGAPPAGPRTTSLLAAALLALAMPCDALRGANKQTPAAGDQQADWRQGQRATEAGPFLPERPLDQLWMVSCRCVRTTPASPAANSLHYWQYVGHGQWLRSDRERFVSSGSPSLGACVFVAGYGYDFAETRALGGQVYRALSSGVAAERGTRFVIWSWPSDQGDSGIVRDVRATAARTDGVAWGLANWLQETFPGQPVSLIGTSFGARIVGGALHLLGGGRLGPYGPLQHASTLPPAQVVFISPAIDDDWLLPGHRFDLALSQVKGMLLLNNSADPVMKRYHWLYGRRSEAEALGHSGLYCRGLGGETRAKIVQVDAAGVIGVKHGCQPYFQSASLLARMRPYVFEFDSPPAPALRGNSLPASFPVAK